MSPLRDTIDRWRDGALSPGEQQVVAARLRADPAALAEFLDEVAFDQQLAGLLGDRGHVVHLARFDDARRAATSVSGAQRTIAAVERTIEQRATRPKSNRSSARLGTRSSARSRTLGRRRLLWWPFAAAAAVAAALVLVVVRSGNPMPSTAHDGAVIATIERGDAGSTVLRASQRLPAAAGFTLRADDQVLTVGNVGIRLDDGSQVTLEAGTTITLRSARLLAQDSGALAVTATHRASGQALIIATPHATATVVGTRFTVRVADGRTRLGVDNGTVRFAATNGDSVLVNAGGSATAPPETPVASIAGIIGFRVVDARRGTTVGGHELVTGTITLAQATLRRSPIAVLAIASPGFTGPVRFSLDGQPIDPPQNNPPYSLTASRTLTGDQQFEPWRPQPGRHVLRAAPVSGAGQSADLTVIVEGDPP